MFLGHIYIYIYVSKLFKTIFYKKMINFLNNFFNFAQKVLKIF